MKDPEVMYQMRPSNFVYWLSSLLVLLPSTAFSDPPQEEISTPVTSSAPASATPNSTHPDKKTFLRVTSTDPRPIQLKWMDQHYDLWLGDALSLPSGEGKLVITRSGFHPLEGMLDLKAGEVHEIQARFSPIDHYAWVNTSGWLGVGLGALLVVAGVAVHDSVDFERPALREAAQWGLMGGGGTLFLSGTFLLHQAAILQNEAPYKTLD